MEFSKEDRNLLVRVGKTLREEIEREEAAARVAPGALGPVPHWRRRDRLLRDERDLTALRRKLEAQMVPSGPKDTVS